SRPQSRRRRPILAWKSLGNPSSARDRPLNRPTRNVSKAGWPRSTMAAAGSAFSRSRTGRSGPRPKREAPATCSRVTQCRCAKPCLAATTWSCRTAYRCACAARAERSVSAPHAQPLDAAQAARFRQALGLLQSGRHVQALAIAETIAGLAPRAADAWQLLGMCLADNGRQDEANAAFERALALLPGNAMVSRNYGVSLARHGKALRAQGRLEAAEPALRKAIALLPEQASAWVDLGAILRLLGRIEEALAAFRKAEATLDRRGASTLELQDAINGVLVDAGRPAEALARTRRLVALHPDHVPAHE